VQCNAFRFPGVANDDGPGWHPDRFAAPMEAGPEGRAYFATGRFA